MLFNVKSLGFYPTDHDLCAAWGECGQGGTRRLDYRLWCLQYPEAKFA
jgi:hypothetical protein